MSDTMDDMGWNAVSRRVWAEHDKAAHGNTSPSACSALGFGGSAFLSHIHHAYAQTDGTYAWPNSREGDMLRQAKREIESLMAQNNALCVKTDSKVEKLAEGEKDDDR